MLGIQKEVHSLHSKKLSEDRGAESEPRKLVEVYERKRERERERESA